MEQDSESFVKSLDVDSLFTNIPFEKIIDICANTLFENTDRVEDLSKIELQKLLSLTTKESYFIFTGKLYRQDKGVTMGSPLGLTLVNAFLVYFEKNWLPNCPSDCKAYLLPAIF